MVKIKLSKKIYLASDNNQFSLSKLKIIPKTIKDKNDKIIYKKGDEILKPFAHYSSLQAVLKSVPDRILMNSNITTLENLIKKYNKIVNKITSNF